MTVFLQTVWDCGLCQSQARTGDSKVPMHPCKGLKGLVVPLKRVGTKVKHERVERGDWVGREEVQTDAEGNVFQSVLTTRDDGQDATVFAPVAKVRTDD